MSSLVNCTPDDHAALRSNPQRLRRETPTGRPQMVEGAVEFYCRECPACLSTLAIEPAVEEAARAG